jgi:hypothetical protein
MNQNASPTRLRTEVQALVRLYNAMSGTAIGLASVSLDGLDQTWRDRVQRIRALPREAPRRKHMIEALIKLIEHTLWNRRDELESLRTSDAALAAESLTIAQRGNQVTTEQPTSDETPSVQ